MSTIAGPKKKENGTFTVIASIIVVPRYCFAISFIKLNYIHPSQSNTINPSKESKRTKHFHIILNKPKKRVVVGPKEKHIATGLVRLYKQNRG